MNICFDLRALQIGHENRGIGTYVRSLLENIEDQDNNQFTLYIYDSSNPLEEAGINLNFDYKTVTTPYIEKVVQKPSDLIDGYKISHHSFKELSTAKPDVFVQFDYNLGIPNWSETKTLVVGYDLIPIIMKNQYNPSPAYAWRNSNGLKGKLRASARALYYENKHSASYNTYRQADHIICISESAAKSFVDLLGVDKDKISTVHLAPISQDKSIRAKKPAKIPDKPYIFYIGGTDTRKQINHLVKAFNIVRGRGLDVALVLAGNEFNSVEKIPDILGRNEILNSGYIQDIHTIGFVSDEEKKYLYAHAYAFIFSSSYEGFGLPVIEAMAEGTPVVTYENSSIPEAGGGAAIYAKDGDYLSLANKIIEIKDLDRDEIIANGKKQAEKFNWSDTASKTLKVINTL